MTRVVMGLLFDSAERILIAKRSLSKRYGGFWEFPGGRIEQGESAEDALIREIFEELNAPVSLDRVYPGYLYEYQSLRAEFIPISGRITPEDIALQEHDDCRFISLSDITGYNLSPYDHGAVQLLKSDAFQSLSEE